MDNRLQDGFEAVARLEGGCRASQDSLSLCERSEELRPLLCILHHSRPLARCHQRISRKREHVGARPIVYMPHHKTSMVIAYSRALKFRAKCLCVMELQVELRLKVGWADLQMGRE